jgi:glycosyltransferase involved in cell wall biosynthesis
MNSRPVLSIIVPVYNVEEYLGECIDSILSQTYKDYELILIDDGSTDGSGQMCDSFVDERIQVIHQQNSGISSVRNNGLRICRGEYIMFCDSDDKYGDPSTIKDNINILQNHPEIDFVQFPAYFVDGKNKTPHFVASEDKCLTGDDVFIGAYRRRDIINCECWNKIYRRRAIDGLLFPVGKLAEDVSFLEGRLKKVTCAYISTKGQYIYNVREGSLSRAKENNYKLRYDTLEVMSLLYQDSTHYPSLHVQRLSILMELMIEYIELKVMLPSHDFSEIRSRLYCYRLRFKDVLGFNKLPNIQSRHKKHAWALFLLWHWYELIYYKLLTLTIKK